MLAMVLLGLSAFVLRAVNHSTHSVLLPCSPEGSERRLELLKSIVEMPADVCTDAYTRALANYSLAHVACKDGNSDEFRTRLAVANEAFMETGNATVKMFIDEHLSHGCGERCTVEMGGVMDGTESQFGAQVIAGLMPKKDDSPVGNSKAGAGTSGVSKGGGGTKLGPGGKGSTKAAPVKAAINGGRRPDSAAKEVESELKAGYDMYQRGEYAPPAILVMYTREYVLCSSVE
jgi:hypothetical protein